MIPAYRVSNKLVEVINSIGPEVFSILVIDDCCPEKSGEKVLKEINDERVEVIFNATNLGVGGAVKRGYARALEIGSDIVVKIDGDGQMDTSRIPSLVKPIQLGIAEYSKGNRFFDIEAIKQMPKIRILGNLVLSFWSKMSTGYWKMFDPNNGFTAVSTDALKMLPLDKIDNRYFFESDMLFRLGLSRVSICDVPMPPIYADEISSLSITKTIFEFSFKHLRNFYKRVCYSYYLRDFTLASVELFLGGFLMVSGFFLGLRSWIQGIVHHTGSSTGTIGLVAILVIVGLQLLLAFLSYDIFNAPAVTSSKSPEFKYE